MKRSPGPAARRGGGQTGAKTVQVQRIQTGVRIEKRMLLVLKALAGSLDVSLGDLLEGIVLHALEGKPPFSPETMAKIKALREVYGLELTAAHSHHLTEVPPTRRQPPPSGSAAR